MERSAKVFTYPTESFYALGVKATDAKAVRRLFQLKHREPGRPIALIAANLTQVKKFFFMNPAEIKLSKKYWPGALTILLKPKTPSSSAFGHSPSGRGSAIAADALLGTTPPLDSARGTISHLKRGPVRIGVRVPAHTGARRLAARAAAPITATSANLSGQPPTKSAITVKRKFPGIMMVPGRCGRQVKPSTVIKCDGKKFIIIRPGSVIIK